MGVALQKLAEEIPSFRVRTDERRSDPHRGHGDSTSTLSSTARR